MKASNIEGGKASASEPCGCTVHLCLTPVDNESGMNNFKVTVTRCAMHQAAPVMLRALEDQEAAQGKIFMMLNSYAKKEHLNDWQCLSLEGLIAQVYGDLAAHHGDMLATIQAAKGN